jgi:hypothetical protein
MTGLSSLLRLLVLPARLLDRILIAWKSITEARRVVAVVLPLLKRTKDVTIVEMRATKSKASRDGSFDVVIWLATLGRPKETSVAIQKLIDLASQQGGQNSARIASLKFQLADAQIAAGDAKQALASVVSPGPAEPETVLSPIAGLQLRVGAFDSALETVDAIGELPALRRRRRDRPRSPLLKKIPNTSRCGEHHEGSRRQAVCLSILRSFCFVDTHRGFSAPPRLRLERQGPAG